MAIIDKERNAVVVRIVYDGPPHAGTTTSINVLGNILGRTTQTFAAETIDLHLDWLEYVGGFFKGYSIACQIVNTPTSEHLRAYRDLLLQTADVIVVVLDARPHESAATVTHFQGLHQFLSQQAYITKFVIQANKQDHTDALSVAQFKELLADYPEVKIIETTATLGKGLRETFVLAVRAAVERADALMSVGKLNLGKPEIETGEALIAWLQAKCEILPREDNRPSESETAFILTEDAAAVSAESEVVETLTESSALEALPKSEPSDVTEISESETVAMSAELTDVADISELEAIEALAESSTVDIAGISESETVTMSAESSDLADIPESETVATSAESPDLAEIPESEAAATSAELSDLADISESETVTMSAESSDLADISESKTVTMSAESSDLANISESETVATSADLADIFSESETVVTSAESSDLAEIPESETVATSAELSDLADISESETVATSAELSDLVNISESETVVTSAELPELGTLAESETALELGAAALAIPSLTTAEIVTLEESIIVSLPSSKRLPKMPDENTPVQWLWPPLTGRQILSEVFKHALKPQRQHDGTWIINGHGNWRFFSKPYWHYPNADEARKALRVHTSLHLQCSPILSEQRCIAVTQESDDTWRLWQILHIVPTLAERLQQALVQDDVNELVTTTYTCAGYYLAAYRQCCQYSPELEVNLDNLGIDDHQQLIYLGTIDKASQNLQPATDEELLNALRQTFAVPIVSQAGHLKVSVETIIEELAKMSSPDASDQMLILTTLAELFVESM